jgi:hypothetical protein
MLAFFLNIFPSGELDTQEFASATFGSAARSFGFGRARWPTWAALGMLWVASLAFGMPLKGGPEWILD